MGRWHGVMGADVNMNGADACENGAKERYKLSDYTAHVIANEAVTDTLYIMELEVDTLDNPARSKGELAKIIKPGQFVHMSIPSAKAHILRRPFSIYATDAARNRVEILYQVLGAGTAEMACWKAGQETSMIGPIGRGWDVPDGANRALLVGGGVGAAPLFMLYEELVRRGVEVDVVLGASSASALVCRSRYEQVCGCAPVCSTDDGTFGRAGFCTSLVEEALAQANAQGHPYTFGAICGPEPLMRIASAMMREAGVFCQVSLERRMACGVGACLSCVVDTVSGKRRACVDGPVFDSSEVVW